jgi:hypothetical protein
MPADLILFLVCAVTAAVISGLAMRWSGESPNWAVRTYLLLLRPLLDRSAESRTKSSQREQFLASWFLTLHAICCRAFLPAELRTSFVLGSH